MACGKNEVTLAPSEIELFLRATEEHTSFDEIVKYTKRPVFKVKSALRELVEANYIENEENKYSILEKGKSYLNK